MALATPPPVRIGDDPTWRTTEFDPQTEPALVQQGANRLPAEGVEWQYWAVAVGADPAQTIRLRCAGPDSAPADRAAIAATATTPAVPEAVVIPRGRHRTTLQIRTPAQVILRSGDQFLTVE